MNSLMAISGKRIATQVAWQFLGTFYKWGGDNPSGFDCSGLIVEILKSCGVLRRRYDATASGLYYKFKEVPVPTEGALACYWNKDETRVVHIEYCLNKTLTIGASGGGSRTLTHEDAIRDSAYIKVRPINYKRGKVSFVDPFFVDVK